MFLVEFHFVKQIPWTGIIYILSSRIQVPAQNTRFIGKCYWSQVLLLLYHRLLLSVHQALLLVNPFPRPHRLGSYVSVGTVFWPFAEDWIFVHICSAIYILPALPVPFLCGDFPRQRQQFPSFFTPLSNHYNGQDAFTMYLASGSVKEQNCVRRRMRQTPAVRRCDALLFAHIRQHETYRLPPFFTSSKSLTCLIPARSS
jgi:hypothetical protein